MKEFAFVYTTSDVQYIFYCQPTTRRIYHDQKHDQLSVHMITTESK